MVKSAGQGRGSAHREAECSPPSSGNRNALAAWQYNSGQWRVIGEFRTIVRTASQLAGAMVRRQRNGRYFRSLV
jgi:hypothetical protein